MKRNRLLWPVLLLALLLFAGATRMDHPITMVRTGRLNSHVTMTKTPKPVYAPREEDTATFASLLRACLKYLQVDGLSPFTDPETILAMAAQNRLMLPEDRDLSWDTPVTRAQALATLSRAAGPQDAINEIGTIPDYPESAPYFAGALAMYRAGIWAGEDSFGNLGPEETVTNGEITEMIARLNYDAERIFFTPEIATHREPIVYGQSGAGRDLMAYRFGEGENVLVLSFAIHGFEDNWDRDGTMLVQTAELLMDSLDDRFDLVEANNWTIYVLPCLNPDGLYDGTTCNGDGRRTTWHYDREGNLTEGGIDLNRCFPYIFYSYYDSRNFNGSQPLSAPEAKALAEFTENVMGSANNVLIDAHGWYSQIIVSRSWGCPIYEAFAQNFPTCYYTDLYGSAGYYSAWAAYRLGYDAALFEFPHVPNEEVFHAYTLDENYVNSILWLLENYE